MMNYKAKKQGKKQSKTRTEYTKLKQVKIANEGNKIILSDNSEKKNERIICGFCSCHVIMSDCN